MVRKLYTDTQYSDMAVQANAEGKKLIKVQEEREYEVEVLEWDYIDKEVEQQKIDPETGEPMYDDEGNPIMETINIQVPVPKMVEETIINPETGEEETVTVQAHHTETRTEIVEFLEIQDNPANFQRMFFHTSLGYVSRTVHKLDGTIEDFLNDTLPSLEEGVEIITYNADGTQNTGVPVTAEFIQECKQQKLVDFYGTVE